VEKVYLALVQGFVVGDGEVDLPLRVNRDKARVEVDRKSGKPSHTQYRIVERVHGHTFLECRPLTGRLHQIRVHLAAIGHPLAVDRKYGGARAILLSRFKTDYKPSSRHPERPLIDRLTLHAARLTFTHPATHERLTFEAPLPKDLRATLNQLRRLAPAPPFNAA
jgi:23S rRNA-/tRNA-specific pseudouridylate synthase